MTLLVQEKDLEVIDGFNCNNCKSAKLTAEGLFCNQNQQAVLPDNYCSYFDKNEKEHIDYGLKKQILMKEIKELLDLRKQNQISYKVADFLHSHFSFITLEDTDECFIFKEGLYEPAEPFISAFSQDILKEYNSNHRTAEILGHLRRMSYRSRSSIFSNPNFLCVKNGILDVEAGTLLPFTPERIFFKRLPVTYSKETDCPKIKKFLAEVVSPEDAEILQEFAGYCLYDDYHIHKALINWGEGENGKSVFLSLLSSFLGQENISNVSLQNLEEDRFAVANLHNKYANINSDLSDKSLRSTGTFKQLTGNDIVNAQNKFKNSFSFKNRAKLIFAANRLPATYDDSNAFFRRPIIVNYPHQFTGKDADPNLLSKLTTQEELSGFLNIALEGLRRLLKRGRFETNATTEQVREEYIRKSNPIQAFVEDCLEVDPDAFLTKKEVYLAYSDYCRKLKYSPVAENTFHKNLARHIRIADYKPSLQGKRATAWKGIKLKDVKAVKVHPNLSNL